MKEILFPVHATTWFSKIYSKSMDLNEKFSSVSLAL